MEGDDENSESSDENDSKSNKLEKFFIEVDDFQKAAKLVKPSA